MAEKTLTNTLTSKYRDYIIYRVTHIVDFIKEKKISEI